MPPDAHKPRTVLLAQGTHEDERIALRALRWCETPLLVRSTHDGDRARRLLGLDGSETAGRAPDLVIVDLQMPNVNGDELLRLARADARLRDVPFVLLSRVPEPAEVARGLDEGAAAVLQKPVPYEESLGLFHAIVGWALGGLPLSALEPYRPASVRKRSLGPLH